MLVQNGPAGDEDLPDVFSLVQVNLNGTAIEEFESSYEEDSMVTMCLQHLQNTEPERTLTYSSCILDEFTVDNVEFLTGENATYTIPESCAGGEQGVATFEVSPTDEMVCFDATPVLEALLASLARRRRNLRKRNLQANDILPAIFMIDLLEETNQPGDRFYTTNADDPENAPFLFISPDMDGNSTDTNTTAPGSYPDCYVCGENGEIETPNATVALPEGQNVTCADVEFGCLNGFCSPDDCPNIQTFVETNCGCKDELRKLA